MVALAAAHRTEPMNSFPLHRTFLAPSLLRLVHTGAICFVLFLVPVLALAQRNTPRDARLASLRGIIKTKSVGGAVADSSVGAGLAGITVERYNQKVTD